MSRLTRRHFIQGSAVAGAALATHSTQGASALKGASASEEIRLGFIGCGGRAGALLAPFSKIDGVRIAGLCDPDEGRLEATKLKYPQAKGWKDLRHLIDDESINAVVISTSNHWHCLAAVWAMQAGKDVYVEKPLAHTHWEGQQVIKAARKYDRICQVGTQQRSDPMQAEIKKFLHEEKALGTIVSARCNRYGRRPPIGKRSTPLQIPANVDYNLWLGPAQDQPIMRDKLQYDWHWDWNTGSGEMGNWGVHIVDDLRNNVFLDQVAFPKRIYGGGGRVAWNDAGNTPNVHFVAFDTGSIPVVLGLSNLTGTPGKKNSAPHPGPSSGYIAYCEGGRLEGQRGQAVAYDNDEKIVRTFTGSTGGMVLHQQNFIDAVRAHDKSILTAEAEVGHQSTAWCNLANVAFQMGRPFTRDAAASLTEGNELLEGLIGEMDRHLSAHDIDLAGGEIKLSPILEFDSSTETFQGQHAELANQFLKRAYRSGFEMPVEV